VRHGTVTVNGTAARGNDALFNGKTAEDLLLYFPENGVSVSVDNILQGPAVYGLNEDVRIDEVACCQLRKNNTDGALTRARHSD